LTKIFAAPGKTPVRAVDDVSLAIAEGATFGLVGESGSGKSTIARMIPRLIEPTSGEILYGGRNLVTLGEREMRAVRQEIGIVFQNPFSSLNPRMSVRQLIGEPLLIHKRAGGGVLDRRVEEMMELVGLKPEFANRFPHEFSGGQRQRIGVARASTCSSTCSGGWGSPTCSSPMTWGWCTICVTRRRCSIWVRWWKRARWRRFFARRNIPIRVRCWPMSLRPIRSSACWRR
jgi:ABC-type lipoprotein export system ATPase subunit